MYHGYKFFTLRDIVLYVVAKRRSPLSVNDVYKEIPELEQKNVLSTLKKLQKEGLIKNYNNERGKKLLVGLNINRMPRIRKNLQAHWESNWEGEWENVVRKK